MNYEPLARYVLHGLNVQLTDKLTSASTNRYVFLTFSILHRKQNSVVQSVHLDLV